MAPSLRVAPQKGPCGVAVVHLESPSLSPRVLPGPFWGSNVAVELALTGPGSTHV